MFKQLLTIGPILLAYMALFGFGLGDNYRGPTYPRLLELFHVSNATGAWMFALSSIAGLVTNLLHPKWLPPIGALIGLRIFLLIQVLALSGLAFCPWYSEHFEFLLLLCVFLGVSTGGLGICLNLLVAQNAPIEIRRKSFSGLHAMYAMASILAPLIFNLLFKYNIEWNWGFLFISFIPLFTLLLSLKVDKHKKKKNFVHQKIALKWQVLCGVFVSTCVASEIMISSRLPLYIERVLMVSADQANLYLLGFFVCLFLGRGFNGFVHLPGKQINWLYLSIVSTILSILAGLYVSAIFLSFCGFTLSIFFPFSMDYLSQVFDDKRDGIIASVLTFMGIALVLMHLLFGYLVSQFGVYKAMHASLLSMIFSGLCLIIIEKVLAKKP